MKSLSITTKITIWYTIFLLIITGGFLTILVYTGNIRAGDMARTKLTDSVDDASEEIITVGKDFIIDDNLEFYEDGVYIGVFDENGEIIEGRRPIELAELPPLEADTINKVKDQDGETWYIYDSLFEVDGKTIWVRGIVKDFAESGTFYFVLKIAGVAFPVLVILAALGGYIITRRAFRPVRTILETAGQISRDGDLSRRIMLENPSKTNASGLTDKKEAALETKTPKDEIRKLAEAFNGMFDKLEEAFEKEKRFTSDVSHELRTPLSVIISQSDYALEDEEYREKSLQIINRESKRMASLVNRLLTLSRSDSGRLKPEREQVDFSEMCETIVLQQEPMAEERGIRVQSAIEPGVSVFGDEDMLIRALLNLMDNAIKYGRHGGYVKLSLETKDGWSICAVEDDGIGISEEELPKIWERFYRVDGSRSEEGSGLGLSMVEALVKAHGGSVRAESKLGKGSRFTLMLPLEDKGKEI